MNIEFEDKKTLQEWYSEFLKADYWSEEEIITLPNIPYSFAEVKRELFRRDRLEDMLDQ
jgi:hypothetical protein